MEHILAGKTGLFTLINDWMEATTAGNASESGNDK
jgi:hypothetical protein